VRKKEKGSVNRLFAPNGFLANALKKERRKEGKCPSIILEAKRSRSRNPEGKLFWRKGFVEKTSWMYPNQDERGGESPILPMGRKDFVRFDS